MIDTHCHLTSRQFQSRVSEILTEARDAGLRGAITVATSAADSQACLDLTRHHDHLWCSAGVHPLYADEPVDWDQVIFKGLELHGIYGRRMYETWYKMTQMVLTGFPLHKAMTHHIPIDRFEDGFQLMAAGQCGKVVCDWTGEI